jgi:hypothetical protein
LVWVGMCPCGCCERFNLICIWVSGNIIKLLTLFCFLKHAEAFKIYFCIFFIMWGTVILVLVVCVCVFQHMKTVGYCIFYNKFVLFNSWFSLHTTCQRYHPTRASMCSLFRLGQF